MANDQSADPGAWLLQALKDYEGPLLRYAARLLGGDLDRARDVVQDSFIRLCRQDRAKVEDHLAEWLFTVCRRRAFELKRKDKRMTTLNDAQLEQIIAEAPDPAAVMARQDETNHLLEIVDRLPERQQDVVRLKFQNDLSYKEISRATKLSVSNVGVTLHNAIKAIRSEMNKATSGLAPQE